jgi:hypothetical protein
MTTTKDCTDRVPVPVEEPSLPSAVFQPLNVADLVDLAQYSRDTLERLPCEDEILKKCGTSSSAAALIVEGRRLLKVLAGDAGQPDADDAQAVLVRFVQIDATLAVIGNQVQASCIGEAQGEKKQCQEDCRGSKKKFCGCLWNSFLAKTNCFISIGQLPVP